MAETDRIMGELLKSLIVPQSSQESFHSTRSHPDSPTLSSTQPSSDVLPAALKGSSLPTYDVEAFLNDPRNQTILSPSSRITSPPPKKPRINHSSSFSSSPSPPSSPVPVQLGAPKTSHHVPNLYQLCQEKGFTVCFNIDGDQKDGFGGTLLIGKETIASEQRWRNKKEAREGLAEKAFPIVKEMVGVPRGGAKEKSPVTMISTPLEKNWVGLLLEYHNANGPTHHRSDGGAAYIEYAIGPYFACTCTIPSHPSPFGSTSQPFPSKRAARSNAAKAAVEHLISTGDLNADGSIKKAPKKPKTAAAAVGGVAGAGAGKAGASVWMKEGSGGLEVRKSASYAVRVSDLAPMLGLPPPTYRFLPASPETPNLLTGGAVFPPGQPEPLVQGPLGEVRNVFGKKSAKEECARGVWEVLRRLAKKRGVEIEEVGEDL
ncbi:MAG: hypothetical protein Q9167_000234 [Letrouitia subvulpina]